MEAKLEALFGPGSNAGAGAAGSSAGGSGGGTVAARDLQRRLQGSGLDPPLSAGAFFPRGLTWRVFLNLLPASPGAGFASWRAELARQSTEYFKLREATMPSLTKVAADPLSALASGGDGDSGGDGQGGDSGGDEWTAYYKNVELSNFINGDLDRLYINGIDNEFFQDDQRRQLLLSVLLLWSLMHKKTSYRQGMHEIAGPVLFVLEQELDLFASDNIFSLSRETTLEAHTFYIFSRIMQDLEVLYDPTPSPHSSDKQPEVVAFCTKIQESTLRKVDPQLCQHLEASYVQAQLYGMRWSRLLFGREFPLSHSHGLRLWDFLFSSCLDLDLDQQVVTAGGSGGSGGSSTAAAGKRSQSSALLNAVADVVLAMLLFVREDLLSEDSNVTMGLLMHYPALDSVGPVLGMVDLIRRGALPAPASAQTQAQAHTLAQTLQQPGTTVRRGSGRSSRSGPPAWLLGAKQSPDSQSSTSSSSSAAAAPARSAASSGMPIFGSVADAFGAGAAGAAASIASLLGNIDARDPLGGNAGDGLFGQQSQPPRPPVAAPLVVVAPAPAPAPAQSPSPAPVQVAASPVPKAQPPIPPSAAAGVGDRLYALSEQLSRLQGRAMLDEAEVRAETARRVRALANVLAGLGDLAEYDSKHSGPF